MSTEPAKERKSRGGVGTGAFTMVLDHLKSDRDRDAEQQTATIEAMRGTIRMLGWVIAGLVLVLALLVSGVVGVGVTGKIPGLGEVTFVQE